MEHQGQVLTPFWVLGWDQYYPYVDNFVAAFETREEAEQFIEKARQRAVDDGRGAYRLPVPYDRHRFDSQEWENMRVLDMTDRFFWRLEEDQTNDPSTT